jgi:hypothetical protein
VEAVYLIAPPCEEVEVPVMLQLSMERGKEERERMAGTAVEQAMLVTFDPLNESDDGEEEIENKDFLTEILFKSHLSNETGEVVEKEKREKEEEENVTRAAGKMVTVSADKDPSVTSTKQKEGEPVKEKEQRRREREEPEEENRNKDTTLLEAQENRRSVHVREPLLEIQLEEERGGMVIVD